MYRYTVENEHPYTVNIFNTDVDNEVAFIYQPHEPSGRDWESKNEAEIWAQGWITSMEYAEANPPSEQDLLISKLGSLGISINELKIALGIN